MGYSTTDNPTGRTELDWIGRNLWIIDKRARLVRLRFNAHQARLYALMARQALAGFPIRILVLKARQLGISTGTEAILFSRARRLPYCKAFVCAHDDDQSAELFRMVRIFEQYQPQRLATDYSSRKEIMWSAPHKSSFQVQTAGKERLKRGSTIHYLHLSEVAFYNKDKATLLSVLQAVPDLPETIVVMESTANGVGGAFYDRWQQAVAKLRRNPDDLSGYLPIFFSWLDNPDEYARAVPDAYEWGEIDEDEQALRLLGATDDQLYWRRCTIAEKCGGDAELFKQEYPSTPNEAFLLSGRRVLQLQIINHHRAQIEEPTPGHFTWDQRVDGGVRLVDGPAPRKERTWLIWRKPVDDHDYAGALDIAEGKASDPQDETSDPDFTAGGFIDRVERRIVAGYEQQIDADLAGEELLKAGIYYNNAWITPEANASGQAALLVIKRRNYARLYRRRTPDEKDREKILEILGWKTTTANRDAMIDDYIAAVRPDWTAASEGDRWLDRLIVPWERMIEEEETFVYTKTGKREHRSGCFDDILFGIFIAWQLHLRCPRTRRTGPAYRARGRSLRWNDGVDPGVENDLIAALQTR